MANIILIIGIIACGYMIGTLLFRKVEVEDEVSYKMPADPETPSNTEVYLPSGKVLTNEDVLSLKVEEYCDLDSEDLRKIIDYAGHRMYDANMEGSSEVYEEWNKVFELASATLYGYL